MKKLLFLLIAATSVVSQEISKDLAKLDPFTATNTLENLAKTHYDQVLKDHEATLAAMQKNGVVIIKNDTLMNVDKPVKIAFAWPISYGQKLSDKSNQKREPQIIALFPAKDAANKDIVQKWQISRKDGTVKAIQ